MCLHQLKVMSAIEHCRTAALGGHVARCADCAYSQIAYNSCRNRHCPKCQGAAARAWLAARQAELLPVAYYHVVFTLPAPLGDIAYQNKAVVYAILFSAAAETLITIAADPKHLGARIGLSAVLHTWGSALTHHPHVHCIVPGGDRGVTFTWKDYRAAQANGGRPRYKTMTLATSEFIRRFLLHVLPDGFHRIRHYGLFANGARRHNLARARQLLVRPLADGEAAEDTSDAEETAALAHPCPCCGGPMIITDTFEPCYTPRAPPAGSGRAS